MKKSYIDIINEIVIRAKRKGIVQLTAEDEFIDDPSKITIKGKSLFNFSSCSYLGLETDPRLKQGAIEAVQNYGTQFSCSRAYVSNKLYGDLELLLERIFDNNPIIVTPSVTLGHQSALPVLISENDLIIRDQAVHNSVTQASYLTAAKENKVVRHNSVEQLEQMIAHHQNDYKQIWYLADGIYSMYGDKACMEDLVKLLYKYDNFYLYVDDAHGMSWYGENGKGFVMQNVGIHEKMVVAVSLNKSFAAGGGALIFQDARLRDKVRNCGGTLTFSGPIQPANLGAAIESAKIHLTHEIKERQENLAENIDFFIERCQDLRLPLVNIDQTPIFYIGVGQTEIGYRIVSRLLQGNFYVNMAAFPAVSKSRAGIRIPITLNNSKRQIEVLLHYLSKNLNEFLNEESIDRIRRNFKIRTQ